MERISVYKYLDEHGIQVRFDTSFSIGVNPETMRIKSGPRQSYKVSPNPFGLDDSEFEEVILQYIYDTVGVKIDSLRGLRECGSLNGFPFLVSLFSKNSDYSSFGLAFGKIKGSMFLYAGDGIIDLGNIEHIEGDLRFKGSSVKSLGKLRFVDGSVYVRQFDPLYTLLETLGNLERVGGDCILKQSPISSIGKLAHVGGNLNIRSTKVESIETLRYVGGNLFLPRAIKSSFDKNEVVVGGSVKFFSN